MCSALFHEEPYFKGECWKKGVGKEIGVISPLPVGNLYKKVAYLVGFLVWAHTKRPECRGQWLTS